MIFLMAILYSSQMWMRFPILICLVNSFLEKYTGLNICMDMFYYQADNWMFENDRPLIWTFPKVVSAPYLYLPRQYVCLFRVSLSS